MKALAPGMMVMGIIFFMGTISGAHLNPAVTLAFAARGNFPLAARPRLHRCAVRRGRFGLSVPAMGVRGHHGWCDAAGPGVSTGTAALMEGLLTLGLVSVILGTATGARNIGIAGAIAVGSYIGLVSVWGAR